MQRFKCTNCGAWFTYKPKQSLRGCVFYYDGKGLPPFTSPYNAKPMLATFNYCKECG